MESLALGGEKKNTMGDWFDDIMPLTTYQVVWLLGGMPVTSLALLGLRELNSFSRDV